MSDDRVIAAALESWFAHNARDLPWRCDPRDPYRSLVSEFMLQQTQVSRVLEKFEPFVARFPTIVDLADADEDDVLSMWSGLGYYRRARMLHRCALAIVELHDGIVPGSIDDLVALPGIGRYTAGAISSIVFGNRDPIVDGNVTRVLQRIHNIPSAQTDKKTVDWSWTRAAQLVESARDPGAFNESMMELGATVCTPKNIRCDLCPLKSHCSARDAGTTEQIPPPKLRAKQKTIYCASLIASDRSGNILVEQRPQTGMWAGLWQVPTQEHDRTTPVDQLAQSVGVAPDTLVEVGSFTHITTHRRVEFTVLRTTTRAPHPGPGQQYKAESSIDTLGISNAQKRVLAMRDTIEP